jgi:hypothetical protein
VGAQSTASWPNFPQYSHRSGQSAEKWRPTCLQFPHVIPSGRGRDSDADWDDGADCDSGGGWGGGNVVGVRWVPRKRALVNLPSLDGLCVVDCLVWTAPSMVAKASVLCLLANCICDVLGLVGWGVDTDILKGLRIVTT